MTQAVMREWEVSVRRADIDAWVATFRERVLNYMRSIEGFQIITLFADRDNDPCQVTALSAWEDMAATKRLAVDGQPKMDLPDFIEPFLTEYDEFATSHDVVFLETKP